MYWRRPTGRSDVIAMHGMVASSQPLATQAGIEIIRKGGNAIDAAVATAAVLDVVEPFSTGCGGDAFALIHLPGNHQPISINGSGRSGSMAIIDNLLDKKWTSMPIRGGAPVTVPGAMHLWHHVIEKYGSLELSEVLAPAIHYASNGFPVSPLIAQVWSHLVDALVNDYAKSIYLINGRAPRMGEIMRNKDLGKTFSDVATEGLNAFYSGRIAESVVKTVQEHGGFLTLEDLESHKTIETSAISTNYRGMDVFEHPPNGQGFAALIMLNIMEQFDFSKNSPLTAEHYHLMIEAKKLAYADLHQHNADPSFYDVPLTLLLSKVYARKRCKLINSARAMTDYVSGMPVGGDTVYLATADGDGRAVSFINSLYMGFGSGLVAPGTGIKLQNRGSLFSLDPEHPNCYEPQKLPFHTIIPGALYQHHELVGVFGIMGGSHQAQAHAQFVSNIVDYEMGPQAALDHPRFDHNHDKNLVALENGVPPAVQGELSRMGHKLVHETASGFGGGQAILRIEDCWIAGSDYRKDGQAAGF
ncbi:MAG: gamma-glutamyltransferase [Candidatus Thorarchaeota archaeon]|nr:gamma-glutamyltransferase [Candidatus Thorarchaeota archaeon]